MSSFRSLRYASIIEQEQKLIEDATIEKMEKWKYYPFELKSQVTNDILKEMTIQWNNAVQTKKNIKEQTLRRVMPKLSDKEIKDAMKKYESGHTPRF